WDLRVVVEDRPGMIADISGHLHSKGLNIKDMSVVKVREGETGSVRIAFGTREQALEALAELEKAGYPARLRE
ncbi:MAG: ACT domain-containing protein, partial [Planctomycetota bacterium]|nr:ACT domain-containing protein [Planctomycetota bacterium]